MTVVVERPDSKNGSWMYKGPEEIIHFYRHAGEYVLLALRCLFRIRSLTLL
jgi:hypothetical protein